MKELFHNPVFVRLFCSTICSQLGSTIGMMAFAFYVLDRFVGQPNYASAAEMVYSAPTLLVFLFTGVLADRFDRQKIAAYTGWIRAGLTLILLLALALHAPMPLLFLFLFTRSAVAKFFAPAESALMQGVLSKDQYVSASGLNQTLFGIFALFSTGLGALTYSWIGIEGAMMVDGIGFVLSALLIASCKIDQSVRLPNGKANLKSLRMKSVLHDFLEGMNYIRGRKLLFYLIIGFALFGFINGGFSVLPLFTMKYKLAPDQYRFFASLFSLFFGIGFLIGSALGTLFVQRLKPYRVIMYASLMMGLLIATMGYVSDVWLYLPLVMIVGIISAPLNIALGGWMPQLVDSSKRGRVNAWIDPTMMLSQTVMLGLITLFYPAVFTLGMLYGLLAFFMFAAGILYICTLPRHVRLEAEGAEFTSVESERTLSN